MCFSIFIDLCFFKEQFSILLNPLERKKIRVDTMPNSLLREINSLRSGYYAFRFTNIKYSNIIVRIGILFILIRCG
jgi:hypothetical protein